MTPEKIIQKANADGVKLTLSMNGKIKATGDSAAVYRWLEVIRERKAEIIHALTVGASSTATAFLWLIHFPDCVPLKVACHPEATHAEMMERYPDAAVVEPFTPPETQPALTMSADEERAIRAWLALIDEIDPATIAEVIDRCHRDVDARDYLTGLDTVESPQSDQVSDDRRACQQCTNLVTRQCRAAKRGEIVAAQNYEPIHDLLHRCEGYAPGENDPDQRAGRERWPQLISLKGMK